MADRQLPILKTMGDARVLVNESLRERGIPRAVYDFIEYNLGTGAALAACMSGKMRVHNHVPGEACACS
jgi:hypothetical protein